MVGSKGAGGSGVGKVVVLTRDQQFALHNPNSLLRVLTREEKRMEKIKELRKMGFSEMELKQRYEVPPSKIQDPPVGPLNEEAVEQISVWACDRIDYLHLMCYGKRTKQALADQKAIVENIKEVIRPRLVHIYAQIRLEQGVPVMPPKFFNTPLEEYKLPASPSKGKGKGKK